MNASIFATWCALLLPQQTGTESALYRACYLESAVREFGQAADAYAAVAAAAERAGDLGLAATAELGRGRCLAALGQNAAAEDAFRRALALDPAREEAAASLRSLESAVDGALADQVKNRIRALIDDLGASGQAVDRAQEQLVTMGQAAVPLLVDALATAHLVRFENSARALAEIGGEEASAGLLRALGSELPFRSVLGSAFAYLEPSAPAFAVIEAAAGDRDERLRLAVAAHLKRFYEQLGRYPAAALAAVIRRLAADPAPQVRAVIWNTAFPAGIAEGAAEVAKSALQANDAAERARVLKWALANRGVLPVLESALLERAADPAQEVRSSLIHIADAARGGLPPAIRRDIAAALLGDPDRQVRMTASEVLVESGAAWTEPVASLVAARLIAEMERPGAHWKSLLDYSGPGALSLAQLHDLYAASADVASSWLPDAVLEAASARFHGDAERHWTWLQDCFAAAVSERGQLALLRKASPRGPATQRVALPSGLIEAAARSPHPRVREEAYDALGELSQAGADVAGVVRALPHVRADVGVPAAAGTKIAREAFALLVPLAGPEFLDAARAARANPAISASSSLGFFHRCASAAEGLAEIKKALRSSGMEAIAARRLLAAYPVEDAVAALVELAVAGGDAAAALNGPEIDGVETPEFSGAVVDRFIASVADELVTAALVEPRAKCLSLATLVRALKLLLARPDAESEIAACRIAGELALAELKPDLALQAAGQFPAVRREALRALEEIERAGQSADPSAERQQRSAAAAAEELLQSPDPVQRQGAAFALGALGEIAAIPALLELLSDTDAAVRGAALKALERLGESGKPAARDEVERDG